MALLSSARGIALALSIRTALEKLRLLQRCPPGDVVLRQCCEEELATAVLQVARKIEAHVDFKEPGAARAFALSVVDEFLPAKRAARAGSSADGR